MINFESEFKNKKIIITGHTGLKGSWLTAILISYGAKVIEFLIILSKIHI